MNNSFGGLGARHPKSPPPKNVKPTAAKMQRMGRNGDTLLAHIDPQEARALQLMGGAGTRNPRTGLLEFWDTGGGVASGGHGDTGDGTGGAASGNGAGGKGSRNDSKQGTAAAGAAQGHLGAGYGSGSQTGIGQGDIDKMVTGGNFSSPGFGITRGVVGGASLGHTPDQRSIMGVLSDIASGAWNGMSLGSTVGSFGGPAASILGGTAGLIGGGIYGGINGSDGLGDGMTRGQNTGAPDKSGSDSSAGNNSGGLASGGNGGPGNSLNDVLGRIASSQGAAQPGANPTNPAAPQTIPTTPISSTDLLKYLYPQSNIATNPIPGYTGTSRFGTATIAPLQWYRPTA